MTQHTDQSSQPPSPAAPPAAPPPAAPAPGQYPPGYNPTGGLIPYRNTPALISYYMGIFSIIPLVGIPLGIIAVVLGIRGLKKANRDPSVKGKVHAWVGIIVGGLFGLIYTLLIGIAVVAILRWFGAWRRLFFGGSYLPSWRRGWWRPSLPRRAAPA